MRDAGSRKGIVFHHPLRTAVLDQAERAHLTTTTSALVEMAVDTEFVWEEIAPMLRGAAEPIERDDDVDGFLGGFGRRGSQTIEWDDGIIDVHALRFNTMIATGSPVFALMARLDAFYEEHAFVEAPDVPWFAEVIRSGRDANILRPDLGWEDVITLCEEVIAASSSEPIVTSCSFRVAFPNPRAADEQEPPDIATWEHLSVEERWSRAVAGIRAHGEIRRLSPQVNGTRCGIGKSAFDLGVLGEQRHARRLEVGSARAGREIGSND